MGKSSERGPSIITSKNKNKTKITPKVKDSLNYKEVNNKEAHQVNENSQKKKLITCSLETKIGKSEGSVESSSWWGREKRPSRGRWVVEHAEEIGGALKWRGKFK